MRQVHRVPNLFHSENKAVFTSRVGVAVLSLMTQRDCVLWRTRRRTGMPFLLIIASCLVAG